MGYLSCSRLRSDSFKMVNITVRHIWKDVFAECLSEISAVDVKFAYPEHRFLSRGVSGEGDHPQGFLEDLHSAGLHPAEKLFSGISSSRVLKPQKFYLGDHEGIALSSVFSFLSSGKAHDLRAGQNVLSPRFL